ncbi:urease accessory UreF family protein [Marinomonas shanghaiensis]|uniref:urease accessory UreF family protein n=1 Tax=Marinomonas shanghaiensis TaxID=2202418 RepID=UPI003A92DE45
MSFVTLFAIAASHWNLKSDLASLGFAWSWLENQIAAATKWFPWANSSTRVVR